MSEKLHTDNMNGTGSHLRGQPSRSMQVYEKTLQCFRARAPRQPAGPPCYEKKHTSTRVVRQKELSGPGHCYGPASMALMLAQVHGWPKPHIHTSICIYGVYTGGINHPFIKFSALSELYV